MLKETQNATEEYDQVIGSIQKNHYILEMTDSFYKFNNRLLLSNNQEFLSAVKNDIGGELVIDKAIGPFLYFGDEQD
jgi:hypothetical protein